MLKSKINFTNHKKTYVLILIILVLGLGVLAYKIVQNRQHRIDTAKLTSVVNVGDCNKGLAAVSKAQPNLGHIDSSIALLSYRASCLQQLGRYQEAIDTLQQLKDYYLEKHDLANTNVVNSEINSLNQVMARPTTTVKRSPEAGKQLTKSINALAGSSKQ